MLSFGPPDSGYADYEEPEPEEWEDEDNPDPYAWDEGEDEGNAEDVDEDERSGEDGAGEEDDGQGTDETPADDLEHASRADSRPWTHPTVGQASAPRSPVPLEEALKRIESSEVEFLYDFDREGQSAYVLARVPSADVVGPLLAASIRQALVSADVRVLRHGVRPGTARDGSIYHYFFRVELPDGSPPSRELIRAALRGHSAPPSTNAERSPDGAKAVSSLDPALASVHAELRHALKRAGDADRRALGVTHIQDRRLIGYRRRLTETEALVRDVLREVTRSSIGGARLDAMAAQVQGVEAQLLVRNKEIEQALTTAEQEQTRANGLADELAWYRDEHEQFVARLASIDERERSGAGGDTTHERDEFVRHLLPEICFLHDSVAVLWNETDRASWLRDLSLLVHDHKRFVEEMRKHGKIERTGGNPDWIEARRTRSAWPSSCSSTTGAPRWCSRSRAPAVTSARAPRRPPTSKVTSTCSRA